MNKFYTKRGLYYVITAEDQPGAFKKERAQAQPGPSAAAAPHVPHSIMQSALSAITHFLARH